MTFQPREIALDDTKFLPDRQEAEWLHMTAFLLSHMDASPETLAAAIYGEVDLDLCSVPTAANPAKDWTISLHGITATGNTLADAAIDWRNQAASRVFIAACQRKKGKR